MKNLLHRFLFSAVLSLSIPSARAAFDPAIVSADARWVVYADLNGLRASSLGKELVAAAEKMQLESNKAPIGIDIEKVFATVGTVTGYGSNFTNDPSNVDGALVIQGTADLRKIAEAALLQATITAPDRVSEVAGQAFPVYAISPAPTSKDKDMQALQVFVAFPPENVILVSKSAAQLAKARDVFRGAQPSLAKNSASPLASLIGNAHSAYLFAASAVPSDKAFAVDGPQARILQMTTAGSLSLGENGPMTFAHIELLASSDAMADKLMKILQGMTAMVSLTETSDKDLSAFMNSATVARTDQTVTLNVAYSSARLGQMIQNLKTGPVSSAMNAAGIARGPGRDPRLDFGRSISEWKAPYAAPDKPGTPGAPVTLLWQTVENVHLTPSSVITLTARTTGRVIDGKAARFDRIEIAPAQAGGMPLVFRTEFMKTSFGFIADAKPSAVTGGKLLSARTPMASAQLQFPGGDGLYTIRVAYLSGPDETTTMGLSIKDPADAAPVPEAKSNDDAAKHAAP